MTATKNAKRHEEFFDFPQLEILMTTSSHILRKSAQSASTAFDSGL